MSVNQTNQIFICLLFIDRHKNTGDLRRQVRKIVVWIRLKFKEHVFFLHKCHGFAFC
jgi:hypothetical protein